MSKLTNNDRHFGCITYGEIEKKWFSITLSSAGNYGFYDKDSCSLNVKGFGWVAEMRLPAIIKPVVIDNGRYKEYYARAYGFSLSDNHFLQIFKGLRTCDSSTDQTWCCHLPWKEWRFVRYSLYDTEGQLFAEHSGKGSSYELRKQCPSVKFLFEDYDGQQITATTFIEERQWERGEGRFKWLSWFYKPMIRRELNLEFSSEVGREKGSWKGGTIGHGIDMLPGEMHEDAFKRYCENEHRSKSGKYKIKFIEQVI